jgi:hypothetical protein
VRYGTRAAELQLAARARDTAAVAALAGQTAVLLDDLAGSGPAASRYRRVGAAPGASADSLRSLLDAAWAAGAPLVGLEDAWLGAWLAAARAAATRRDVAFFKTPTSRRLVHALAASSALDPAVLPAARRVAAAVEGAGPPRWTVLERDVSSVLTAVGR